MDSTGSPLSDPALLSGLAQLISNMQNSPQEPPSAEQHTAKGAEGGSGAFFGGSGGNTHNEDNGTSGGSGSAGGMGDIGGMGGAFSSADLSGILSSAMQNPALMAALPSMVSMLSGMLGGGGTADGGGAASVRQESTPQTPDPSSILGLLSAGGKATPRPPVPVDRRAALLLALKPYMPQDKRSAIDTIVRVIEIMSHIK